MGIPYNYTNGTEIRHGEWKRFSFTKDDVGGDLTDLIVGIRLQILMVLLKETMFLQDYLVLGERRVVNISKSFIIMKDVELMV